MAKAQWGADGLPDGQPKATYYDPFGRSRVLPSDPYSLDHYLSQGLRLTPPESPVPIEKAGDFARRDKAHDGPMSATRQVAPSELPSEQPDIQMLLARIEELEATRKRGSDKKKRKRRRKRTAPN